MHNGNMKPSPTKKTAESADSTFPGPENLKDKVTLKRSASARATDKKGAEPTCLSVMGQLSRLTMSMQHITHIDRHH